MAQIGNVPCDFVKGDGNALKETVVIFRRPGIDGYGSQRTAKGSSGMTFLAVRLGDPSTVDSWITDIQNQQGAIVAVTTDTGRVINNVLVQRVAQPAITAAVHAYGHLDGRRAQLRIEGVASH